MRTVLTAALVALAAMLCLAAAPAMAKDGQKVMLILDASGSMWGRVDGREKILVAREVVGDVLADLGEGVELGVIAYGHRSKGDCGDIETVVPAGPVDAGAIMRTVNAITPKGKTPITEAVRRAAAELRHTENRATVILVSDGLETCAADPCAAAAELEKSGIDFTVHVVGFDLKNEDTRSLQCLAENTGGKYLSADNAAELSSAIGEVVAEVGPAEPEPATRPDEPAPARLSVEVFYSEGGEGPDNAYVEVFSLGEAGGRSAKPVTAGSKNNPFKVPPGRYRVETRVGATTAGAEVEVAETGTSEAVIVLGAGLLKVAALAEEGGKPLEDAYVHVLSPEADAAGKRDRVTAGNQRNQFVLPAGKYAVRAVVGKASAEADVEIKAGERTETTLIVGLGLLSVAGVPTEGAKPLNAYVRVFEPDKQLDGSRRQVAAGNARNIFKLSAGRYHVEVTADRARAAREVEVTAGKKTEVTLDLGAGALSIAAEKTYLTVYQADKNLDGTRDRIGTMSAGRPLILPAGRYVVVGKKGGKSAEIEVEVTPGKLTEATLAVE